jgi:hypothetical protein
MFSSEKCTAICFLSLCIVGTLFISQIGYGSSEGFHEGATPAKNKDAKYKDAKDKDAKANEFMANELKKIKADLAKMEKHMEKQKDVAAKK